MGPLVVNMTYLSRRAGRRKLGPVYIQWRSPFAFQLLPHITEVRPSTVFLTCEVQKFKTQRAGFFKNQTAMPLPYIPNVDWFNGYLTMAISARYVKFNDVERSPWENLTRSKYMFSIKSRGSILHSEPIDIGAYPKPAEFSPHSWHLKAHFNIIFPSTNDGG
jgi:hypothetical protein